MGLEVLGPVPPGQQRLGVFGARGRRPLGGWAMDDLLQVGREAWRRKPSPGVRHLGDGEHEDRDAGPGRLHFAQWGRGIAGFLFLADGG